MIVKDLKFKLIGLIAILCIVLFAYSIMKMVEQGNIEKIQKIEEGNKKIMIQIDSTQTENVLMSNRIKELTIELNSQNKILNKFQKSYDKNLLETKILKNEKNYIPTNTSSDDQHIFISGYEYQEY